MSKIPTLTTVVVLDVRVKSGIFGQTAKFGQPPCLLIVQLLE